jgi:hypothetical protein
MASFQDRVIGAIRLHASTFEEIEHDATATSQAAVVVVVVSAARGLASLSTLGVTGLVSTVVLGLLGWVIGSAALLVVGTKFLPGKSTEADMGQMLRTLGFAQAAGVASVFGTLPVLGLFVSLVANVWILVAMVIAVRQALDYADTLKAVITCVVAWGLMVAVIVLGGLFGLGAGIAGSRLL